MPGISEHLNTWNYFDVTMQCNIVCLF